MAVGDQFNLHILAISAAITSTLAKQIIFYISYGGRKIISEKTGRKMKPDYFFVLPWHFKKEILKRERKIIKKGTKFIFPLPKIQIT